MKTRPLHECLQTFTGAALEVSGAGVVQASNGRLDARVGRRLEGVEFREVLDDSSQVKWQRILELDASRELPPCPWELVVCTPTSMELCTFIVLRGADDDGRGLWLLEHFQDPALNSIFDEMSELNRELVQTQRDLSRERRRIERALAEANAAVKSRDDVLAIVSHDLRSPLNTILGAVGLLELPLDDDRRNASLDVIRRATHGMNRLIGDLLDVSAIDAGRFSIEPAPVSIQPIVDEVRQIFEPTAATREQQLIIPDPPDVVVAADRYRIIQVLSNLVGNALKFAPERGSITVSTRSHDGGVRIEVADTGPGIPADSMPHIFDRFWHANRSHSGGAGLGLAIAKGIVEAHGGRIGAENRAEGGALFWFTLPSGG
jgi:signal transduction histidine kinase